MALETAFVGAYTWAEIGAIEARHLSVLTNIAVGAIAPSPDLAEPLTAAQATAAVKPFLA